MPTASFMVESGSQFVGPSVGSPKWKVRRQASGLAHPASVTNSLILLLYTDSAVLFTCNHPKRDVYIWQWLVRLTHNL